MKRHSVGFVSLRSLLSAEPMALSALNPPKEEAKQNQLHSHLFTLSLSLLFFSFLQEKRERREVVDGLGLSSLLAGCLRSPLRL